MRKNAKQPQGAKPRPPNWGPKKAPQTPGVKCGSSGWSKSACNSKEIALIFETKKQGGVSPPYEKLAVFMVT